MSIRDLWCHLRSILWNGRGCWGTVANASVAINTEKKVCGKATTGSVTSSCRECLLRSARLLSPPFLLFVCRSQRWVFAALSLRCIETSLRQFLYNNMSAHFPSVCLRAAEVVTDPVLPRLPTLHRMFSAAGQWDHAFFVCHVKAVVNVSTARWQMRRR